jgi:hypothetical protein
MVLCGELRGILPHIQELMLVKQEMVQEQKTFSVIMQVYWRKRVGVEPTIAIRDNDLRF